MGDANSMSKTFGCWQVPIVKQMGLRATCRCCSAAEAFGSEAAEIIRQKEPRDRLRRRGSVWEMALMASRFRAGLFSLRGCDMKRQAIGNNQAQIAKSTLQAVAYLIKQNDPARLRAFLAKHTRTERIAIKRQLQRNST
jgi:hypothetical protein